MMAPKAWYFVGRTGDFAPGGSGLFIGFYPLGTLTLPGHDPEYRKYAGSGSEMRPPFMHTALVLAAIDTFQ